MTSEMISNIVVLLITAGVVVFLIYFAKDKP